MKKRAFLKCCVLTSLVMFLTIGISTGNAWAQDVTVQLDDAAGASSFAVWDSNSSFVAKIDSTGKLILYEPVASGTNKTTIAAGVQAANINYTLPTAQGAASTYLKNDGAGALSWASAGGMNTVAVADNLTVSASSASWNNITSLSFDVATATAYAFDFVIVWQATSSRSAPNFGISGTNGTPTYVQYQLEQQVVTVGSFTVAPGFVYANAYQTTYLPTTALGSASNAISRIFGAIGTGGAGTLKVQIRGTGTLGSFIVRKGSWGTWF